ncbi:MAG: hypothetical protein RL414_405 [Actinomycetota bacterium]
MSKNFSLDQTTDLFDNFDSITSGPLADVASALRDLAALPDTLGAASAPEIPADVIRISHRFNRKVTIAIAATGIAAATTLTAAALTGVGPAPVVEFAKKTFTAIARVFTQPSEPASGVETQQSTEEPINEVAPSTGAIAQPSALPDPAPRPTPTQESQQVIPAAPQGTPTQVAKPVPPIAIPTISGKSESENENKKSESESTKTESTKTETTKTETTKTESVKSSPSPVKTETKKSETKKAESTKSPTPKVTSTEKSDD